MLPAMIRHGALLRVKQWMGPEVTSQGAHQLVSRLVALHGAANSSTLNLGTHPDLREAERRIPGRSNVDTKDRFTRLQRH